MNVKLSRDQWINEAFTVLAEGGVDSIKIEGLAKRLRVTKGGFYWHFRNRDELLQNMLEQWRLRRIEIIHEQTRDEEHAADTLKYLIRLYTDNANPRGNAIELAVRGWARVDTQAALAVQSVDEERLKCVSSLFGKLKLSPEEAYARAYLFYAFVFGQSLLNDQSCSLDPKKIKQHCTRFLIED
ncbi:TetR/AcrR family transcriptional regulator [Marinobacterium rhizophilum]|uniref:TetR/AcrR family transcriptional regulator n=1 Tax=Marinobacterium rhizophilum TaxID=420402 RepID=A0ABY5HKE6_9GAMM|nr:TetR/AcrR family transcriptional regulator [Marinobacterium rhizophilum]UTW12773.1 TetR/AcrR family transcriptional regulator [Marinobacterium rhizophilum]